MLAVGNPERGKGPLAMFRSRFLWTLRDLPALRTGEHAEIIDAAVREVTEHHVEDSKPVRRLVRSSSKGSVST